MSLRFPINRRNKPFRDRAATNVACADEEDVFHGSERAANAFPNLEANLSKSISSVQERRFVRFQTALCSFTYPPDSGHHSHNCRFSAARIAVIVTTVPSLFSK